MLGAGRACAFGVACQTLVWRSCLRHDIGRATVPRPLGSRTFRRCALVVFCTRVAGLSFQLADAVDLVGVLLAVVAVCPLVVSRACFAEAGFSDVFLARVACRASCFDQTLTKIYWMVYVIETEVVRGKGGCQKKGGKKRLMTNSNTHLASAADASNVVGFVGARGG